MEERELLGIISKGETEQVEFKRALEKVKRANNDLACEMAAFANTRGGWIIIGVEDDRQIRGVEGIKELEEKIANIASEGVYPPLDIRYEEVRAGGKSVAVIEIPMGVNKPYSPRYIRRGTTKRRATREEERRLFQEGGLVAFDETGIKETTLSDLDPEKLNHYFMTITGYELAEFKVDRVRLFENKGIIKIQDERPIVTIAGMLLFGRDVSRLLPQSSIKLARFEGIEVGGDFIDHKEISGILPEMIEEAIGFVRRHTNLGRRIEAMRSPDIPEYLDKVVKEALVNAVVHRDYSIRNGYIRLFIFDDRLEIRSPGRLPNAASLEELPLGDHHPRNKLLFSLLEGLGYGERIGTGIPRMIRLCRENGYKKPEFKEIGEEFWVTLYGRKI